MEGFVNGDLAALELRLINVSLEDDCLIDSLIDDPQNKESCESIFSKDDMKEIEGACASKVTGLEAPNLMPTNCVEPGKPNMFGKCNLRKSLAWDNAFFTSSGILEPEELTSMIEEVKTKEKSLPKIEEDLHYSPDSLSTLESEDLSLESLEAGLFKDVKASIQATRKAPNLPKPGTKAVPRVTASNKSSVAPQSTRVREKLMPPKKPNGTMLMSEKIRHGEGRSQIMQAKKLASSPKPLETLARAKCVSTPESKRSSLGANIPKVENKITKDISASAKNTMPTRVPSKPPVSSSSTRTHSIQSSKNNGKSPSNIPKKKPEPNNANPSISASVPRSPYISAAGNRTHVGKFNLSLHAKPTSTSKSSISPASSVSDLSAESSSSNSTRNRSSSSSFISIDSTSRRSSDHYSIPSQKQSIKRHEEPESKMQISAKPSGLRMPSPKIGFFDGMKPAAQMPKKNVPTRSRVPSALPKLRDDARTARRFSGKMNLAKHNGNPEPTLPLKPVRSNNSTAPVGSSGKTSSPAVSCELKKELCLRFEPKVHEEVSSCDSLKDTEKFSTVDEELHEAILKNTNSRDLLTHTVIKTENSVNDEDLVHEKISDPSMEMAVETKAFEERPPHVLEDECDKTESLMTTELTIDSSLILDSDMVMNEADMLPHIEEDKRKAMKGMNSVSDICKSEQVMEMTVEASQTADELTAASSFCKSCEGENSLVMVGRCTTGRIPLAVRNSLLGNDALVGAQKVEEGKKVAVVPNLKEN